MKKEFYKRQELLFKTKQENLKDKHVIIIGAGGLGSSIAYALASTGIDYISIVDFDTVSLSNIQRQIMFEFNDVNRPKVDCFAKLQNRSYAKINMVNLDVSRFFANKPKADLIIDATDNLEARKIIDEYSKSNNIPWIFSSVEEFFVSSSIVIKKELAFKKEAKKIKAQTPPIVMFSASFASILAIKYLAGYEIKSDYLYYFDFSKEIFNLNKFNL